MYYPEDIHATAVAWQDSRYPNGLASIATGHAAGPDLFDLRRELVECWDMAGDDDLPALAELAEHFNIDGFKVPGRFSRMSEPADAYEEHVNETHDEIVICGMTFLAGRVLRKVDPIAFRCGYLEYADAEDIDTDDLTDDLS